MPIPIYKQFRMVLIYLAVGGNSNIASRIFSHEEGQFYGAKVFDNLGLSPNYSIRTRGQIPTQVVLAVYDIAGRGKDMTHEKQFNLAQRFLGVDRTRLENLLQGRQGKTRDRKTSGGVRGPGKYAPGYRSIGSSSLRGPSTRKDGSYQSRNN